MFSIPVLSLAVNKTVTVEWTMPKNSITNIQKYEFYYSYNDNMTNASKQTCNHWQQKNIQNDYVTFTMECNNVSINGNHAYFLLKAIDNDNKEYSSNIFDKNIKISFIKDFKLNYED
jgi:hypothetical protein